MQKKKGLLVLLLLLLTALTGCAKGTKCRGDGVLKVTLTNMPEEFSMLSENLQEELTINVTLENISNEKKYKTVLNKENQFSTTMDNLIPGNYRVKYVSQSLSSILDFSVSTKEESVTLEKRKTSKLRVYIKDTESFARTIKNVQPKKKIKKANLFSRKIQFKGNYISLKNITQYVSFSSDHLVSAYETQKLYNSDYGITITVQNTSDTEKGWKNCKLVSVECSDCNVVFPKGVNFGMSMEECCHVESGVYGKPTGLAGTALLGIGYDSTSAQYLDEDSGDKITIQFAENTKYIESITYEFEKYE